jgi:hypothetical protein
VCILCLRHSCCRCTCMCVYFVWETAAVGIPVCVYNLIFDVCRRMPTYADALQVYLYVYIYNRYIHMYTHTHTHTHTGWFEMQLLQVVYWAASPPICWRMLTYADVCRRSAGRVRFIGLRAHQMWDRLPWLVLPWVHRPLSSECEC